MKSSTAFVAALFVIASLSQEAKAVSTISLAPADWTPVPGLGTPRTVISDGGGTLMITSSTTRPNDAAAYSNTGFDMTDGLLRVQWQANGGGTYCAFTTGLYDEGTSSGFGRAISPYMSTRNSWAGSVLLGDGVEYYTTYEFSSDTVLKVTTATGNYYDLGGSVFNQHTDPISNSALVQDVRIMGSLGDSYSSAASFIILSATAELAIPEPSTSLLLLGAGGFLFRRRRQ